jgi:glutaryl-CoA dehydrogenase
VADMFVVWAKTDNEDIRGFILERSMAGITTPYVVAIPLNPSRHPS